MGLTIHYSFKALGSDAHARKLVQDLHQTAQDLPFKELDQVVELSGDECEFNNRSQQDPLRWLLIQASSSVELKPERRNRINGYSTWLNVRPCRLFGFTAWPGDGCEESNFGLCRYPSIVETERGPLNTKLAGWRWSSFCKTQYASNPDCGGVPNFLQCHLTVIAMLDRARELGCLECVSDEGGFWGGRSLPALVAEIGSWNEMIAAFGGALKDLVGDGPLALESAIAQYPNFERLEAAGQDKLPPPLLGLIERVRARKEPGDLTRPEETPSPTPS